ETLSGQDRRGLPAVRWRLGRAQISRQGQALLWLRQLPDVQLLRVGPATGHALPGVWWAADPRQWANGGDLLPMWRTGARRTRGRAGGGGTHHAWGGARQGRHGAAREPGAARRVRRGAVKHGERC